MTPLSAESLSNKMLQRQKYNLNLISHDTALDLVQRALDAGANVTEVYVDTVGSPEKYADKFRQRFPFLAKVDVRKKADSIFRIVGAASIVAKVFRDKVITEWEFEEDVGLSHNTGSGYPADPMTKKWMAASVDRVFGFPSFVRFSWGTTRAILEKSAVDVEWCVALRCVATVLRCGQGYSVLLAGIFSIACAMFREILLSDIFVAVRLYYLANICVH